MAAVDADGPLGAAVIASAGLTLAAAAAPPMAIMHAIRTFGILIIVQMLSV